MNNQTKCETYRGIVVPEPVLLRVEKKDRWGHVPGLDDSELADVNELERAVLRAEWGPVLELPVQGEGGHGWIQHAVDESGGVDWGAFGTVDFSRTMPDDATCFKADKLREQLKNAIIMFEMIRQRLPRKPASLVLKYLRMGIIDLGCIADFDAQQLGIFYLRARSLRKQITELEKASWSRKQRTHQAWLGSLG